MNVIFPKRIPIRHRFQQSTIYINKVMFWSVIWHEHFVVENNQQRIKSFRKKNKFYFSSNIIIININIINKKKLIEKHKKSFIVIINKKQNDCHQPWYFNRQFVCRNNLQSNDKLTNKKVILICYRPVNSGKLLSVDMTAGTKNNAFQSGVL